MAVREVPFSELLSIVIDNRGRSCPTSDAGIPLIATNCIRNELLYPTYEKARFVSLDTYATWFRGHPKPGDILFVNKATPGRVCLVPDPVDFCIAQDMVAVRADAGKIYPRFLFAVLRSQLVQKRIGAMHVGTLIPHFKKGDFDKLLIPVPDRMAQEFTGDIYYELSAKIELNRRMNETLEAMARAVFQSWFVDFDGQTEFVGSELGRIPNGWRVSALPEVAKFLNGIACQKYPADGGDSLPVVKIRELHEGVSPSSDRASMAVPKEYVVADGDLLFSWSGSLEVAIWTGGPAVLNQHLFKVTSPELPLWLIHRWLLFHLPHFRETAADKATTMGHIKREHLQQAKVVVPAGGTPGELDRLCSAIHQKQLANQVQSRTLATLRDTLLPKLISGELRIKDAERFLEKTT
jgi:type I restriction enzyme, S subunit